MRKYKKAGFLIPAIFIYSHVRLRKPHKALLGDNDIIIDALTAVRKAELHVGVFAFKL